MEPASRSPHLRHFRRETRQFSEDLAFILVGIFVFALCCYFFSEYSCCPFTRKLSRRHIRKPDEEEGPESIECIKQSIPRDSTPDIPDVHQFKFTTKKTEELYHIQGGSPTLDLHGLTAEEARHVTRKFLLEHSRGGNLATGGPVIPGNMALGSDGNGVTVKIVTGRGLHSSGGIPTLKPLVENILRQRNLRYTVTSKGGAFTVHL